MLGTDVTITWHAEVLRYKASTGQGVAVTSATVVQHERWYQLALWHMGDGPSGLGGDVTFELFPLGEVYDAGAINSSTDTHASNGLTLSANIGQILGFGWNGWDAQGAGFPSEPSYEDTGSSIILRGRGFVGGIGGPGGDGDYDWSGVYLRRANCLSPISAAADDMIFFYIENTGGAQVTVGGAPGDHNLQVRFSATISI